MIAKIGGTNGSGKTTLMRGLMDLWDFKVSRQTARGKVREYTAKVKPTDLLGHHFNKVVVLGSYENECGGMDTIMDKEERLAMVAAYVKEKKTLVLYEGLITGKTYGAMGALSERSQVPWLYVFMDTPFDECVRRIMLRRTARGVTAPFDAERTVRPTYKSVLSVIARARTVGHPVHMVNHKQNATRQAKALCAQIGLLCSGASKAVHA